MLGQLHLHLTLAGVGVAAENIQYQGDTVNNLYPQGLFQVALLQRRQLIVKDGQVVAGGLFEGDKLFQLATADIVCPIG